MNHCSHLLWSVQCLSMSAVVTDNQESNKIGKQRCDMLSSASSLLISSHSLDEHIIGRAVNNPSLMTLFTFLISAVPSFVFHTLTHTFTVKTSFSQNNERFRLTLCLLLLHLLHLLLHSSSSRSLLDGGYECSLYY